MLTDQFAFSDDVLASLMPDERSSLPVPPGPLDASGPAGSPFVGLEAPAAFSLPDVSQQDHGVALAGVAIGLDSDTLAARSGGGSKPGGGGGGGGGSTLTSYTSGDAAVDDHNEFNVTLSFSGSWTAAQQAIVTRAADLISKIITADVMDDTDPASGNFVDDIAISISTGRIDGSGNPLFGNVLAQTQLLSYRDAGTVNEYLPVTAKMTLDSTDLKNSVTDGWFGTWDDIILHEMMHAIGFAGPIFDLKGLVNAAGNFAGQHAVAAYGGAVPIETGGGSGTAGSHWDENAFSPGGTPMSNELMTGWVKYNEQTFLSDTTVAALTDLGYTTADPSPTSDYLAVNLMA